MKRLTALLFIFVSIAGCIYQPKISNGEEAFIEVLDTMYHWDNEKQPQGA